MDPYLIMVFIASYFKNHCLCDLDLLKSLILNFGNRHRVMFVWTGMFLTIICFNNVSDRN